MPEMILNPVSDNRVRLGAGKRVPQALLGAVIVGVPVAGVEELVAANYLATAITLAIIAALSWTILAFCLRMDHGLPNGGRGAR